MIYYQKPFKYNSLTGKLYRYKKGKYIECRTRHGKNIENTYLVVSVKCKIWYVHRFVWTIVNGTIPKNLQIDHINHVKDDNRLENLRLVSHLQNHHNMPKRKNQVSYPGIHFCNRDKKWVARIWYNCKSKYLGEFNNQSDAIMARKKAEVAFKYHENHNKML